MNVLLRTADFDVWLKALRDAKALARILARIRSAEAGNFGDCKSVGDGVSEMRVDVGPGYRVYFARRSQAIFLLLGGGDKSTQRRDIANARKLLRQVKQEEGERPHGKKSPQS